jgi:hypothetical protein
MFLGIGLRLLGVFGWIKRMAGAAMQFAMRKPWIAACIALALFAGWQTWGKAKQTRRADQVEADFAAFIVKTQKAQDEAIEKQFNADRAIIAAQVENAEIYDELSKQGQTAARTSVAAYAERNPVRVCRQAADRGSGGGTPAPTVPGDPGPPAGPDADPGMVAVARSDLDHLAKGAVQNAIKTRFLSDLVQQGYAVRASDIPQPELSVQP